MDNRDIFDEEFDRVSQQQGVDDNFGNWSSYQQPPVQQRSKKPLHVVLMCLALVACLVLGWVLAVITQPSTGDQRKDLLNEVFDYMDYKFYEDISQEEWELAVEQAGSVLMQYAGDQFSFLMSPQTYYDFDNNVNETLTAASSMTELFGMMYSMETNGMLISDVSPDSASYGNIFAGDLIVKMTDIKEYQPILDKNGNFQLDEDGSLLVQRNADGTPNTKNSQYSGGLLLEGATTAQVGAYLQLVYSANFHILRDGEIKQIAITRNKLGIQYDYENVNENKRYDFEFVKYYFSENVNNVSTTPINGASTSFFEERGLANLPAKTGYINIIQFDDYGGSTNCYTEFASAMKLFAESGCEYLVLDLKGNPGGYVHLTVDIAGLLISDKYLTDSQKASVTTRGELLVTSLVDRKGNSSGYGVKSTYANYFPQTELTDGKKRIVVWTDGGSASASELLTGTLLDYQTAVHIGTQTYGKGIAQTIEELDIKGNVTTIYGTTESYPWAVYYTFAKYYSPLGKNIQGAGYTPSVTASTYQELWTKTNLYWGN